MNYVKRGDDLEFLARRVRSNKTGELLPGSTLTWRLMKKSDYSAVSGAAGSMAQYDVVTASYEGLMTKVMTAALALNELYVLEIIITNAGRQTTVPVVMRAVDVAPTAAA